MVDSINNVESFVILKQNSKYGSTEARKVGNLNYSL